MKIRNIVNSLFLAGLLMGSSVASAATVLVTGDDAEIATGILNLDVNGFVYNVDFDEGTADEFYGTGPRTFDFDNASDAQAANDAIVTALNDVVQSDILLVGGVINNSDQYGIGFASTNGNVDIAVGRYNDPVASAWANAGGQSVIGTDTLVYANFQPAVIPVPAAVWLFGSALGVLGWLRRMKKSNSPI
jgi:hypothetical protein